MRPTGALSLAVLVMLARPAPVFSGEAPAPAGVIKVGDEVVLISDGPGKTIRVKPAVGFGKDSYLVVWQEGWHGEGGSSRIHAVRVGLDGKALDPAGVEIAPFKTGVQENPRVAFFGGVFLVVWQDLRNGKDCDVLGARVSPEGKVLDAQAIPIAAGPRTQAMPDVAADDKGFMVVWHGFQGEEMNPKVFAARVGPDGAAGQAVVVPKVVGSSPRIAWNGKKHLVSYFTQSQIHYVLVDTECKPAMPRPIMAAPFSFSCQISVCGVPGKGWAMVSQRATPDFWGWSGPGAQVVFSITSEGRFAADGPSREGFPDNYSKGVPPNWLDTSLGKKGVRRPLAGIAEIWPYGESALAWDGQQCVAVWQRYHTGGGNDISLINGDVLASRLDGWKPLDKDGVPVAASAADELDPAMAGDGSGKMLCVYEKVEDGKSKIAARTLETQQAAGR